MIYLQLFVEFFKIGLFSFGGGYATIPFLAHISEIYGWYSLADLRQMIAVAALTPGAVGINVATFAGLNTAGVLGSLIATFAETLPSLILILIIYKIITKYRENFYTKTIIKTLKPIGCGLLVTVFFELSQAYQNDIKAIILFFALLTLGWKSKKDPVVYMLISALIGVLLVFI